MNTTTALAKANLRQHARRYVSTTLAITLSLAFLLVALIFGRAVNGTIEQSLTSTVRGAAVHIESSQEELPSDQAFYDKLAKVDGVSVVQPVQRGYFEVRSNDELSLNPVQTVASEKLPRPELLEGNYPTSASEIALYESVANTLKVKVGDTVQVKNAYAEQANTPVTVAGVVKGQTGALPENFMTLEGQAAVSGSASPSWVVLASEESLAGEPSIEDQEHIRQGVEQALGEGTVKVTTYTEQLETIKTELENQMLGTQAMLLLFPTIATTVALIVVATTFRVVLHQRQREIALLRTLGATSRQVRRLIVLETLGIGAVASLLAVTFGSAIGVGLLHLSGIAQGIAAVQHVSPLHLLIVAILGIVLAVLVGYRPAAGASKTPPLLALQSAVELPAPLARGVLRSIPAYILFALSVGAVAWGLTQPEGIQRFGIMLVAGVAGLVAILGIVGPFFPGFARALGAPFKSVLPSLARENTMRNPGRTRSTGTAIIIGVTLVSTMMIGAASLRTTLINHVDANLPLDLQVHSLLNEMPQSTADRVGAVEGVKGSVIGHRTTGRVSVDGVDVSQALVGGDYDLGVVGEPDLNQVSRKPVKVLAADEMLVASDPLFTKGGKVTLCVQDKCSDFRAVTDDDQQPGSVVINDATLLKLTDAPQIDTVYLALADGVSAQNVQSAIVKLDLDVAVSGAAMEREMYNEIISQMLLVVIAMLGVSIIVSVVGVANTLSLSVHERSSENGLLRALGLTRRQMRRLLLWEATLITMVATFIGMALGFVFAWLGMNALPMDVDEIVMVVPWAQLALVVLVSFTSTLLATWLPSRRAARTSPIEALAVA